MDAQSAAQEAALNIQITFAERACEALEEELGPINKLPAALLRWAFSGELWGQAAIRLDR